MNPKPTILLALNIDGKKMTAPRAAYAKAKLNQLREFGYSDLTFAEVEKQIDAILAGNTLANGLTVIGGFMEEEILKP